MQCSGTGIIGEVDTEQRWRNDGPVGAGGSGLVGSGVHKLTDDAYPGRYWASLMAVQHVQSLFGPFQDLAEDMSKRKMIIALHEMMVLGNCPRTPSL